MECGLFFQLNFIARRLHWGNEQSVTVFRHNVRLYFHIVHAIGIRLTDGSKVSSYKLSDECFHFFGVMIVFRFWSNVYGFEDSAFFIIAVHLKKFSSERIEHQVLAVFILKTKDKL